MSATEGSAAPSFGGSGSSASSVSVPVVATGCRADEGLASRLETSSRLRTTWLSLTASAGRWLRRRLTSGVQPETGPMVGNGSCSRVAPARYVVMLSFLSCGS